MKSLAVLPDFLEEQWPSMDLCAEMLVQNLDGAPGKPLHAQRLRPAYRPGFARVPFLGRSRFARNADRLRNRFRTYPRFLRGLRTRFDFYHICDHTYSQLIHSLPAERTGIYCHDLDAFRSLLEPERDPRPRWFRALARQSLNGFQKAAVIFHSTSAVRREIERFGLIDPAKLAPAPYGVAVEFTAEPVAMQADLLGEIGGEPFLLHVGSCIPRKRIDVLLRVFAEVRRSEPALKLLQIGGDWTAEQQAIIAQRGLAAHIQQVRGVSRLFLAEAYRQAKLVLQPSESEGFGLPVIEALACGASVVASDLPVLREVGGAAVSYCPVGDERAWTEKVVQLLQHPERWIDRSARLAWASRFTWEHHAATIAENYLRLQ